MIVSGLLNRLMLSSLKTLCALSAAWPDIALLALLIKANSTLSFPLLSM
jgi:hypothetical protein